MQNTSRDYVNSLPLVLPLPSQREQTIVLILCKKNVYNDVLLSFFFFFFFMFILGTSGLNHQNYIH